MSNALMLLSDRRLGVSAVVTNRPRCLSLLMSVPSATLTSFGRLLKQVAGAPYRQHVPPGTLVGRYRVIEELGVGGMGVVYKAYDPELDRCVAIKLVSATTLPDELAQRRLLREAQALARIAHPNVLTVHDVGTYQGGVFMAAELAEGATLREWARQPRSRRECLEVLLAAGRGLAAVHAAGLVHRDFKPDNVIIGHDGRVRVIDLGLAFTTQASTADTSADGTSAPTTVDATLTRTGGVMGTPAYMAPEQHEGHKVDARSDQFGFCVTAYELLSGERPFTGTSLEQLAAAITGRELARPSNLSRHTHAILRRGLSADPTARHKSMDELLDRLHRTRQPRWLGFAVAAAVAMVIIALLVGRFMPSRRTAAAAPATHHHRPLPLEIHEISCRTTDRGVEFVATVDTNRIFSPKDIQLAQPERDVTIAADRIEHDADTSGMRRVVVLVPQHSAVEPWHRKVIEILGAPSPSITPALVRYRDLATGLTTAIKDLQRMPGRRVLIVVGNEDTNVDPAQRQHLSGQLRARHIETFAMYIGSPTKPAPLRIQRGLYALASHYTMTFLLAHPTNVIAMTHQIRALLGRRKRIFFPAHPFELDGRRHLMALHLEGKRPLLRKVSFCLRR